MSPGLPKDFNKPCHGYEEYWEELKKKHGIKKKRSRSLVNAYLNQKKGKTQKFPSQPQDQDPQGIEPQFKLILNFLSFQYTKSNDFIHLDLLVQLGQYFKENLEEIQNYNKLRGDNHSRKSK